MELKRQHQQPTAEKLSPFQAAEAELRALVELKRQQQQLTAEQLSPTKQAKQLLPTKKQQTAEQLSPTNPAQQLPPPKKQHTADQQQVQCFFLSSELVKNFIFIFMCVKAKGHEGAGGIGLIQKGIHANELFIQTKIFHPKYRYHRSVGRTAQYQSINQPEVKLKPVLD